MARPNSREADDGDWFADVTAESGVDFTYQTGQSAGRATILETVGGGVGLVDYDRDSQADLYAIGGGTFDFGAGLPRGRQGKLFRNMGGFQFTDVTSPARLTDDTDYSHGVIAGDVDHDGFPELFVTCYGRCRLWRNLGDGTFSATTESAGLETPGWHTAAAFADMNGDCHLDLFVADYVDWNPKTEIDSHSASDPLSQDVPPPQRFEPLADHLFLNLGDGRFSDVSGKAGIRGDGMGLGVVAADLNEDGQADLYVANDVVGNHLYWGGTLFPLREQGELSGSAYNESGSPEGSMGVDAEDVNGDGLPDLWVTNFELEDNSLYHNQGREQFQHATARMGLAGAGRLLVGFGTGFLDFDSDGWPDLYVLNGHVQYHSPRSPFRQLPILLRNQEGRRFEDVTAQGGPWFRVPHTARGGAVGDLNGDGSLDLVISCLDEPITILRNRLFPAPTVRVRLVGVHSPRDPIGASIRYQYRGRTIVRVVKSGAGYLSQSDDRITLPLDSDAESVEFAVRWPSQRREVFREKAAAEDFVLVEGRGTAID